MHIDHKLLDTLDHWQTLTAGVLAIVAAIVGGLFVFGQSQTTERRERRRLGRVHMAARSVMPLALSAITEYSTDANRGLAALVATAVAKRIPANPSYAPPILDPVVIPPLRDVIETASDKVADRIARLIAEVQVLQSRLRDLQNDLSSPASFVLEFTVQDYILSSAAVHSRTSDLFSYARRETNKAPSKFPTEHSFLASLRLAGFDEATDAELFEKARKRAKRWRNQSSFWLRSSAWIRQRSCL